LKKSFCSIATSLLQLSLFQRYEGTIRDQLPKFWISIKSHFNRFFSSNFLLKFLLSLFKQMTSLQYSFSILFIAYINQVSDADCWEAVVDVFIFSIFRWCLKLMVSSRDHFMVCWLVHHMLQRIIYNWRDFRPNSLAQHMCMISQRCLNR